MFRWILALAGLALATPVAAQVVTYPTLLPDGGDGVVTINKAITTPPVPRGTDLVLCEAAPAYTYAVKGTPCPVIAPPRENWWGVNVSGLEFATELPVKISDINFYADAGARSIRLPIKRTRFKTEAKLLMLDGLVKAGTDRGMMVVLDEHSYSDIGNPDVEAFWLRIGPRYRGNPLVAFDLQNEPNGGTWESWGPSARRLIHNLRAAGIDNRLVLEWRQSSGSQRADKGEPSSKPCASALCSLNRAGIFKHIDLDPLQRTWLSNHRYFDSNGSGTGPYCRKDLSMAGAFSSSVSAARKLGMQLYVGEMAWGAWHQTTAGCAALAPKVIEYLRATPEFVGGAMWGWGPRWKTDYHFRGEHAKDRAATWETLNGKLTRSLWAAQ